jgi:hypothetical protein
MYRNFGVGHKIGFSIIVLASLMGATAAVAQVQIGDNLSMRMNGSLGFGYTGSFGNYSGSTHGQGIGANANLDGYYFHPDFLSFTARPYYDRSSSTSDSQSITRSSGIGASLGLFGGSHFPGSVTYGLDFSSNSQFYVAGVPSVLGDSSGHNFGVTWSELLPNLPHVYMNYNANSSSSTLLTSTEESQSRSKNLNLNSDYRLAGFDLRANFNHNANNFTSPEFLTGQNVTFGGSGTTYGVTAQHNIPFGAMSLGVSHSTYDSDQGGGGSGTNYYEGVGVTFFRKLSLNETFNYTTNTTAALSQSLLNGATPILLPDQNSEGLSLTSTANLVLGRGLSLTGHFSHRRATFNNQEYSDNQYGGSVNYNHQSRFLGFLNFSVGFVDTATQEGNSGAGVVANVGMSKKFGHWDTSADLGYFQTIQTLYAVSTTSSYNYGGSVRRKIGTQTHWSTSFRAVQSGLTPQAGSNNQSQSFSSSLSWRRYSGGGNYSQSSGLAVLNSFGTIVATPVGPLVGDNNYIFNARTWGVNGSTRLFQRLTVGGGFNRVSSDTTTGVYGVLNSGDRYYARGEYLLRRFSVQGGYSRVSQEVSTIPGGPRIINSYYITISRWFNVF